MSQLLHYLNQSPLLVGLPPVALQALHTIAHLYRLRPQEILFHYQDPALFLYIVAEGSLRLVDPAATQPVNLRFLGVGDVFGIGAIKADEHYPGQVEAIQESVVIGFAGVDFRHVMSAHPALALLVADWLITLLHQAHDRVRQMAAERVEQRLAKALLFLGEKFGKTQGRIIRVELPLSRQDLADFAGTTVETVSRTLSQWEKQGWVRCGRRQVAIIDETALRGVAQPNLLQTF